MQDDSPSGEGGPSGGAKAAMTVAAVAYPAVTAMYFWSDWFRFLKTGGPVHLEAEGFVIRATAGMLTLLTPWRLLIAVLSTGLLATSAKRLWQKKPGAGALSLLVLGGLVLPQALWYGELSLDWYAGSAFGPLVVAWLAAVLLPAALLLKRGAGLIDWKGIDHKARVVAAGAGLGWVAFGAISVLEHLYQFADAGSAVAAALATVPLAGLGMLGLWKKRTWGLLASGAALGAHALMVLGLAGASYWPSGRAMDDVMGVAAASPANAVVAAALPALVFVGLLAPFVVGLVRRVAGAAPLESVPAHAYAGAPAVETSVAPRVRIATPTPVAPIESEFEAWEEEAAAADAPAPLHYATPRPPERS